MVLDPKEVLARLRAIELEATHRLGVSADDPSERGRDGVSRRSVVAAWRSEDRRRLFANAEDAASWAGISRRGFYNLLAKSAEGIGDDLSAAPARNTGPSRRELVEAAEALIAQNDGASAADVARMLAIGPGAGLSRSTLVRLVAEGRRRVAGSGTFGELIALDSASIDLVDGAGRRRRLYAAVDVGTRLILTWHVAGEADFEKSYDALRTAFTLGAAHAVEKSDLRGLDLAAEPRLEVSLPDDPSSDFFLASGLSSRWTIVSNPRRFGGRIIEALGTRVADFRIAAGVAPPDVAHRSRVRTSLPIVDERSSAAIHEALTRHDRTVLHALPRGTAATAAAEHVTAALRDFERLTSID